MRTHAHMHKDTRTSTWGHMHKNTMYTKSQPPSDPGSETGLHTTSRTRYLASTEHITVQVWGHMHICIRTHAHMHKDTCLHSMRTHAGEAWGYKKRWHEDIRSKEGTHIDMRTHAQARMFMQQNKWAWGHKIETWGNMVQSIRTRNMVHEDSRFTSWG